MNSECHSGPWGSSPRGLEEAGSPSPELSGRRAHPIGAVWRSNQINAVAIARLEELRPRLLRRAAAGAGQSPNTLGGGPPVRRRRCPFPDGSRVHHRPQHEAAAHGEGPAGHNRARSSGRFGGGCKGAATRAWSGPACGRRIPAMVEPLGSPWSPSGLVRPSSYRRGARRPS